MCDFILVNNGKTKILGLMTCFQFWKIKNV